MRMMVGSKKDANNIDDMYKKLLNNKQFQIDCARKKLNTLDHTEIEKLYDDYVK